MRQASKIETLRFYHFDLTANDPLPNLNISSFPTMMIFPAQNKTNKTVLPARTTREC
ncbi:hypothetical protein T484DRAFT_1773000 [Baffinella frigidus]|nr:hypothetical protein T484DRAFT_1773000 [Cryptophyta sp. CCMP2293]